MSRLLIFAVFAFFFAQGGCTTIAPLRQNTTANPKNSVIRQDGYQIAFIELGEQGSYQDPRQLQNAIELIQEVRKPLIITYVHGWQNNVESDDVTKFEGLLTRLNQAGAIRQAGFNVVGVYLGWRGKMSAVPILKELTFYDRKAAAERIASNFDCYDAIASISEAARKYHQAEGQYTILLGHSFGGLIVERSVAHAINAEIHGRSDPGRSMPADLMIVVNPASDSILARQMIAALYSRRTEGARPLFVSITSTGDWATGLAFPAGTKLAAATKVFNEVAAPGVGNKLENERKFYTSTPGHNELLINHVTVKLPATIASPQNLPALEENLEHNHVADGFALDAPNGRLELWQLKRVGEVDVPYWDVKVDPSIIKDHGDIWNERAEAMMAAIFRMANPTLNPRARPRATLHRAPDFSRLPQPGH